MLTKLFPRSHRRYLSLSLLGPCLNDFAQFLSEQGYPPPVIQRRIQAIPPIELQLRRSGCRQVNQIQRKALLKCAPPKGRSQENINAAATVRLLGRYFDREGVFSVAHQLSPVDRKVADYREHLEKVRGFAASTIHGHLSTIEEFLTRLDHPRGLPARLKKLKPSDLEQFMRHLGGRLGRGSLQHSVSHLRSFLRYLASRGEGPPDLDGQIDTPRVYRGEQLPRTLPWQTVQGFLQAIDRFQPMGKRDYAMFLLMTTYGLRGSEVVGLKLDEIEWRARRLRIHQRKTASPLILPLTDEVGNAILAYLKRGRPPVSCREVFVRHRAPAGTLKPTAVVEAFQSWSRRSGLSIPYQGAHCIRHSYAVHLLRQGTSMKTIGDVLGHRNLESTFVYLRLSVEDLRTVPLSLPSSTSAVGRSRS